MPALVTRLAVPIAKVGVWSTATGVWECTREQLADAVAAQADPAFRTGVLKLGHLDPRFTDGQLLGDGEPAVGRLENLRLTDDGNTLLSDLVGVPAWLDAVMATAYPSRSIEADLDVTSPSGTRYAMVVTGLALLGVERPAIESLGDIADLFGTSSDLGTWVAARRVAASALPPEGAAMPDIQTRRLGHLVVASASIDELASAFEEWAKTQPLLGPDSWVRDIYTDRLIATVWRGDDASYWAISWAEADGVFTFGEPSQVRPSYEPVPAQQAAASAGTPDTSSTNSDVRLQYQAPFPVRSARGREAAADALPEETHVPLSPAIAERLGVPVDADDETVLAAVTKLEQATAAPDPVDTPEQDNDQGEGEGEGSGTAEQPEAVAAALKPVLASLSQVTAELASIKAEKVADAKKATIDGAVAAGKIRPADRDHWSAQYDQAPAVVDAILASIAPGTAVPVAAAGHAGEPDQSATPAYDALYAVGSDV